MIPSSHSDLLERPLSAVLTTEMPDGRLQSTVVWFGVDGQDLLVNTMREFQKARNLALRPRATVLIMEPPAGRRWIEIRAEATFEDESAAAHLDALALAYEGADRYFGGVVPAELAQTEHPVICRLRPLSVMVGPTRLAPSAAERGEVVLPTRAERGCREDAPIPASHLDLLERPLLAALATRLPRGAQTQPTWFDLEGNDLLVNTTLERAKGRNMVRDPRATLLVIDPANDGRWIEVRGDVDLRHKGAREHLDRLTRRYTSHPAFYGHVYPLDRRERGTRVIARIHPRRINRDAVH
jgi:PPOX class probable F420-dependent enzyme